MKQVFTGLKVKEMAEFFSTAQTAEINLKERSVQTQMAIQSTSGYERSGRDSRRVFDKTKTFKAKKVPPNQCFICKKLGYPGPLDV